MQAQKKAFAHLKRFLKENHDLFTPTYPLLPSICDWEHAIENQYSPPSLQREKHNVEFKKHLAMQPTSSIDANFNISQSYEQQFPGGDGWSTMVNLNINFPTRLKSAMRNKDLQNYYSWKESERQLTARYDNFISLLEKRFTDVLISQETIDLDMALLKSNENQIRVDFLRGIHFSFQQLQEFQSNIFSYYHLGITIFQEIGEYLKHKAEYVQLFPCETKSDDPFAEQFENDSPILNHRIFERGVYEKYVNTSNSFEIRQEMLEHILNRDYKPEADEEKPE